MKEHHLDPDQPLALVGWRGSNMHGGTAQAFAETIIYLTQVLNYQVRVIHAQGAYLHDVTRRLFNRTTVPKWGAKPFEDQPHLQNYEFIFTFDHDNVWKTNDLQKLIDSGKEIIGAQYVAGDGGFMVHKLISPDGSPASTIWPFIDDEPHEVASTGFGCTVIRHGVLEDPKFPCPWVYRPVVDPDVDKKDLPPYMNGIPLLRLYGEDVAFGCNARDAGHEVYVHGDVMSHHAKTIVAHPQQAMIQAEHMAAAMEVKNNQVRIPSEELKALRKIGEAAMAVAGDGGEVDKGALERLLEVVNDTKSASQEGKG